MAVLVFGLLVGIFHFQGDAPDVAQRDALAATPEQPASYLENPALQPATETADADVPAVENQAAEAVLADNSQTLTATIASNNPYAALAAARNNQELSQLVADIVAANPDRAGTVVTIALAQMYGSGTLGDIATLAATATKAAPEHAPAIAGAIARSIRDQSDPALAAAIATVIALVPEQTREVGLVVGAVIGADVDALGMVAQTVAIATGEETFSSLSEASGVSMSTLMKKSAGLGVKVPFDVPAYAAQLAPSASMVAGSVDSAATAGDM
ncbi:MAG: hypothetical protein ABJ308_06750 [Halieaceae bacterium]